MSKKSNQNVHQRIHSVMTEMKKIQKNGRNDFHKYDYATEADYVEALRPLLEEHGLSVTPELVGEPSIKCIDEDKGNYLTTIRVRFTLTNIDNPEEQVECVVPGQGADKGDKGVYKALTGAKKYWAALTFMVATGDDPERDEGQHRKHRGKKRKPPTDEFEDL